MTGSLAFTVLLLLTLVAGYCAGRSHAAFIHARKWREVWQGMRPKPITAPLGEKE
jgi:hypothetical protein